jgi:hypothetical protein
MTIWGFRFWAMVAGVGLAQPGLAQMHKVAAPEEVVRAVGVYEWTGDMARPMASRLIPVSLFINGQLEDAGVYLARPIPFALDIGTLYEVDQAGLAKGTVDLLFARHLEAADLANTYDDGWFGYGDFHGPRPPKPVVAKKTGKERRPTVDIASDDPNRPTLHRKPGSEGDDASSTSPSNGGTATASSKPATSPPADPDRPHLTKRAGSDGDSTTGDTSTASSQPATGSGSGTGSVPADDPDRPHLTKRAGSGGDSSSTTDANTDTTGTQTASTTGSGQDSGSGSSSGSKTGSADDADRPTLRKRTPEQAKQARKEAESSRVTGESTSLNDDPNRPHLQRGVVTHAMTEADFPKLKGVPENLHQMVAVSDAKNREPHNFAREWKDDTEKAAVLASMEALARSLLAGYGVGAGATAASPAAAPTKPAASAAHTSSSTAAHKTVRKKAAPSPDPPPVPLLDEELKGYTLSYGGADTFVYMAHTDGDGAALRYVTVVAQRDALGALKPAIQSVTDAAHLDRTPWMRLVDVVDAEASNRASLLFELRGSAERQFGLYRVIAARAEQTLLTGTTQ